MAPCSCKERGAWRASAHLPPGPLRLFHFPLRFPKASCSFSKRPQLSLGNQYEDDSVLRSYLARTVPADVLRGGELYQRQLADRLNEPTLTQWDEVSRCCHDSTLTRSLLSSFTATRKIRCALFGDAHTTAGVYQRELSPWLFKARGACPEFRFSLRTRGPISRRSGVSQFGKRMPEPSVTPNSPNGCRSVRRS